MSTPNVQTVTAAELLTMLQALLRAHGTIPHPDGGHIRCECRVCLPIYEMFDEADEHS